MEETVLEDHLQQDIAGLYRQFAGIDPGLPEGLGVVDLGSPDAFERADPGRGGVPEGLGNVDTDVASEFPGEAFRVAGFLQVVQFRAHRLRELVHERDGVQAGHRCRGLLCPFGELRHDLQVPQGPSGRERAVQRRGRRAVRRGPAIGGHEPVQPQIPEREAQTVPRQGLHDVPEPVPPCTHDARRQGGQCC